MNIICTKQLLYYWRFRFSGLELQCELLVHVHVYCTCTLYMLYMYVQLASYCTCMASNMWATGTFSIFHFVYISRIAQKLCLCEV